MKKILRIGHRGAKGYAPENTLLSFQKALDLRVDMIELDVYRCKSGEIVVIHGPKLEKTTNGRGYVIRYPLYKLKLLSAGKRQRIPTLTEALDLIRHRAIVNIEIKSKRTAQRVHEIVEHYVQKKGWKYTQFIVSSFRYRELLNLRELNKRVRIGLLFNNRAYRYKKLAVKVKPYSVHVNKKVISARMVKLIQAQGYKLFAWTVNRPAQIELMKKFGVDGIFSDYPDRI